MGTIPLCFRVAIPFLLGFVLLPLNQTFTSKHRAKSFRGQIVGVWTFKAMDPGKVFVDGVLRENIEREWDIVFDIKGNITLYRKPLALHDSCNTAIDSFRCSQITAGVHKHYDGWEIVKKGCYRELASNKVSIEFATTLDRFEEPRWKMNCGAHSSNYEMTVKDSKLILVFLPDLGEIFDGKVMTRP